MRRTLVVCALLVATCALASGCGGDDADQAAPSDPPTWSHDPDDPELGPDAWGDIDESFEQCLAGLAQSPVDIAETTPADLPDLELDYPETRLVVENTGHTIEVPMPDDGEHTLTVGGDEYRLVQFHFHAPSEHTLGGESYAAEAHLVHESDEGKVAVLAIFIEAADTRPALVDAVLESAPEEAGDEVELDDEWSPLRLLLLADSTTAFSADYFTYRGSLTTPGCTEGVRWFVVPDVYPTRQSSIDRLHELIADFPGYDGYENNNRPAQPLNDRQIERNGR